MPPRTIPPWRAAVCEWPRPPGHHWIAHGRHNVDLYEQVSELHSSRSEDSPGEAVQVVRQSGPVGFLMHR
jgi:hypothetical protein